MSETETRIETAIEAAGSEPQPGPQPEAVDYVPFEATVAADEGVPADVADDLERPRDVPVGPVVEIGRTRMTIGETLALGLGSIITLDRLASEPVDLWSTASRSRAARSR